MTSKTSLSEFYVFLERYADFYEDFLTLETQKYEAISQNSFRSLDDFIKQEQVFMMKSKGLEQEKESFLKLLGQEKSTLRDLIKTIPDQQEQLRFNQIYKRLSGVLLNLKEANRLCNFLIELHLHRIDSKLQKLHGQKNTGHSYDTNANKSKNRNVSNLSKKV